MNENENHLTTPLETDTVPTARETAAPSEATAPSETAVPGAAAAPRGTTAVASRVQAALAAAARALAGNWQDLAIVAGLVTLFVHVHRRVDVVEFGGDAVIKWQFVRQWWYDFDWKHANLYHHHGRMGVNGVAWLAQALFGRGFRSYYVAPFFVSALQLPFVYAIGKRVVNRLAGVIAALLITYLATVHRSASQLLPDGFVGTYAIIAAYFCLRFYAAEAEKKPPFLVAMAVSAFAGYLAKETFVFFFPGMALAIWLVRRSPRDELKFFGILLGGLLIETALYAIFTQYHSRYQVVRSVHGADGIWEQVHFVQLFDRFAKLHNGWKYLFFFALASGLWLLAVNKQKPASGRALAIIGFSHVFFLTFLVRGFNPIEIWQSFEPRYMEPFTPFAALFSGSLLAQTISDAWSGRRWPPWVLRYGPGSPSFAALWCLVFVFLVGRGERALTGRSRQPDGVAVGNRIAKVLNDTYARNLPIAQVRRANPKVLQVMYDVYLDDALLAKDGKLPDLNDVVQGESGLSYFVQSPAAYRRGKLAALRDAGCVVQVERAGRYDWELSSWEPLPAHCDDLLRRGG